MKASELRIGNLLYQEQTIDDWEIKSVLAGTIIQCEINPDGFEPIALTEEWLEKFGFKHYVDGETHEMYTPFGVFEIQKHKTLINGNECKHLQYVHQLQNLYFALTGEELTLKK